jgi:hypothetical protein
LDNNGLCKDRHITVSQKNKGAAGPMSRGSGPGRIVILTKVRKKVTAHMLNLRPNLSAVFGAINWMRIVVMKYDADQSEMWFGSKAGAPVSGSFTVAKASMKPWFAMMLPITELAYPAYLETDIG